MSPGACPCPCPCPVRDYHVRRAKSLASYLGRRTPWLADELESAAMFGLATAAARFDPGRGVKFWTYARRAVAGSVIDVIRAQKNGGHSRRTGRPWPKQHPLDEARDYASADLPVGWEAESEDEVRRLLRLGGLGSQLVADLYLRAGLSTLAAAGREHGCSESNAWHVRNRVFASVRSSLAGTATPTED